MNDRARRLERRLQLPLLVAALLTIPAIAVGESDVSGFWAGVADVLNWGTWLAFVVEAVLMLRVVDDPRRWLRDHPLEVVIVVLAPPVLPVSLQAARALRLLRLLRVLRAAQLTRRLWSGEGVRDAAVLAVLTVLAGGEAFTAVERGHHPGQVISVWDGVWWAVETVTTVGYGDFVPVTVLGRVIGIVVMIVGIGFVAIVTAGAAERFIRQRRREARAVEDRLDEIVERLDALDR